MGKIILFWLNKPDGNLADDQWGDYVDLMAVVCLVTVVLCIGIIFVLYRNSATHLLIRKASDPFGPYTPLSWLFLSILPGIIVTGVAWYLYDDRFSGANSFAGGSAMMGLYCLGVTLVLSYAAVLAATPVKFKYRARIWA